MFNYLYNYWKKPIVYLNTNDENLKKHLQALNKIYIKTCDNLNLQPEKQEITSDLIFKPNLQLIYIDTPVMVHTYNIDIERYNEANKLLENLNYEEFIKQFGSISFVTRENDNIIIKLNLHEFRDILNKSIHIYKDKIETKVYFYNSSVDNSIFPKNPKTFKIYDIRI